MKNQEKEKQEILSTLMNKEEDILSINEILDSIKDVKKALKRKLITNCQNRFTYTFTNDDDTNFIYVISK